MSGEINFKFYFTLSNIFRYLIWLYIDLRNCLVHYYIFDRLITADIL